MKSLVLFLAFLQIAFSLSGECNSYEREKLNEGYRTHGNLKKASALLIKVYKDSKGIPTIGVGFNLMKSGARQQIAAVGANYDKLLAGTQGLNDNQIRTLFNQDMATAVSCVSSWIGNWSSLSTTRQSAIADMSFNLGCGKNRKFFSIFSWNSPIRQVQSCSRTS